MEKEVRREIRRTKINSGIIAALAAGGILSVALLAPSMLSAFGRMGLVHPSRKRQAIKKSLTRLVERGYVHIEAGKASLTKKGESFAATIGAGRFVPRHPRTWDGKWRVLIFDIQERRRGLRERLRRTLIGLGFIRLQDSVWVFPYDCEDLITLLKLDFQTGGKDILYIIADKIENDAALRKHFELPR